MASRRAFLSGMLAAGLAPSASWADVGAPTHLAAARRPDGSFVLCGLDAVQRVTFAIPLPGRGHAAAAHPHRPEAIAFARRPGTFALVLECLSGEVRATLDAPAGRHFYGHGTFSADGTVLFTTENDFETAEGRIGLWDAARDYARLGDLPSGGIGPHDILTLPGADILAVANGGIETHPDSGRAKLNLPTMRPNLSYVGFDGEVLDQVAPEPAHHLNSLRHLAVRTDGLVAFASQWQGPPDGAPPLLGLHRLGDGLRLLAADDDTHRSMQGYAGSVAFSDTEDRVAITSPKGGLAPVFDVARGQLETILRSADVCGVSAQAGGFLFSTGSGALLDSAGELRTLRSDLQWDNHLVALVQPG